MPRRDGTGPMGNGPQTGWGDGYCADAPESDNTPQTRGRGFGRGSGRRRGRAAARAAAGTPDPPTETLLSDVSLTCTTFVHTKGSGNRLQGAGKIRGFRCKEIS